MKTEDLKNYIFEQYLTEAKTHPLVMRGAQWVADNVGGDPKKIAGRMSRGIKRTTNEPTAEHVYNAAQFHFGEILRKNSPSMDRPEVYADARKRLRAHLGLNEDVKSVSKKMQKLMLTGIFGSGAGATIAPYFTPPGSSTEQQRIAAGRGAEWGTIGGTTVGVGELSADALIASGALGLAAKTRRRLSNESALNFINGLKRLNELTGVTDELANQVLGKRRAQYVNKVRDIISQDRGSLMGAKGEEARMNRTQKLVNARQARKTGDAEKPVTGEEYREDYPTTRARRPVRYGFGGPLS